MPLPRIIFIKWFLKMMYAYCELHQLVESQEDGKQMGSDTVETCGSELIIIAQNLVKFKYAVK